MMAPILHWNLQLQLSRMLIFLIFSFCENVMVSLKIVKSPLREMDGLETCKYTVNEKGLLLRLILDMLH